MQRLILAAFAALAFFALSAPAQACINDSDTIRTEREFRQNYEFKPGNGGVVSDSELPSVDSSDSLSVAGTVVTWSGLALMAGAAGLVTVNFRRSSRREP